jgi:hypothetical protein
MLKPPHANGTSPRMERIHNLLAAISPEAAGGNDMVIVFEGTRYNTRMMDTITTKHG